MSPLRHASVRRTAFSVATWLLALLLLWLAARNVDWQGAASAARHARVAWLAVAVVANAAILLVWAALWRMLLPTTVQVRFARMFEITALTSAIMNTVPALVGHASAIGLLVKRGNVPVRTAAAVVTVDQLGEGLSKVAVFATAVALVGMPEWMAQAAAVVATLVGVLCAVLLFVARFGGIHVEGTRVGRLLTAVRMDLEIMRSPGRAIGAVAMALCMKALEAGAIAGVILALDVAVPATSAVLVLAVTSLATMLPVTPGNIGTYEAGAVAAYRWMGVSPELALVAGMLQHACFLLPAIGMGVAWLGITGTSAAREALQALPDSAAPAGRGV